MNCFYNATPTEQAYALYLANRVFGVVLPTSLPNSNSNNGNSNSNGTVATAAVTVTVTVAVTQISISGRNAVPFLTQSGVDRGTLRSIWSVADPNGFGTLTSMVQFHVVLRLVAMAQAGILSITSSSSSSSSAQMDNMASALSASASRKLPLPVFSSVVVPSFEELMANYGHLVVGATAATATTVPVSQVQPNNNNNNNNNALRPQVQPPPPTVATSKPPAASGGFFSLQPSALQSVGYAFGGLTKVVADAPLPLSLPLPLASTNAVSGSEGGGGGGFGDFGSAPAPALGVAPPSSIPTVSVTDAFGDLVPVQDAPLPPLELLAGGTATTTNPEGTVDASEEEEEDNDDDDFGTFETAVVPANDGTQQEATDPNIHGLFGDNHHNNEEGTSWTTTATDPNAFSTNPEVEMAMEMAMPADSFVVTTHTHTHTHAPLPVPSVTDTGPSLSITDAFSDMIAVPQDAPLPSLQGVSAVNNENQGNSEDEDIFGGFARVEAAMPGSVDPPSTGVDVDVDVDVEDGFGDFGGAAAAAAAAGVSDNSVNGDRPALSFPGPSITNTAGGESDRYMQPAMTDVGRTVSEPTTTTTTTAMMTTTTLGTGASGVMGHGHHGRSLSINDAFGGPDHAHAHAHAHSCSLSIDDAFGELPAPENKPLPSLEMLTTVGNSNAAAEDPSKALALEPTQQGTVGDDDGGDDDDDDDDDFGDFSGIHPGSTATNHNASSSINDKQDDDDDDDEFGDFGDFGTASLQNKNDEELPGPGDLLGFDLLGQNPAAATATPATAATATATETSDGQGVSTTGAVAVAVAASDVSMFEALASNDAPLPSLETMAATTTTPAVAVESEEIMGNAFEGNDDDDDDDDFGGFETSAAVQAPAANKEVADELYNQSGDLLHGEVSASTATTTATATSVPAATGLIPSFSISDAFGDLEVPDAPLPSLLAPTTGSTTTATTTTTTDQTTSILDLYAAPSPAANNIGPGNEDVNANVNTNVNEDVDLPQSEADDEFGAFGSAEATSDSDVQNYSQPAVVEEDDDDFGDFGSANVIAPTEQMIAARVDEEEEDDEDDDGFGMFGSAVPTAPANQDAQNSQPAVEDDFGDFGSAELIAPVERTIGAQSEEEDDFGMFGSANIAPPTNQDAKNSQPPVEYDFGDFGSADLIAPVEQTIGAQTEEDDDFGVFGSANLTPPANQGAQNLEPTGDDFGAFGSAGLITPIEQTAATQSEKEDGFGVFASPQLPTSADESNDDFGDFGSANVVAPTKDDHAGTQSEEDSDFGDFGSANFNAPVEQNEDNAPEIEETDFGDFGNADFTAPAEHTTTISRPVEETDFGDFGSADLSTPADQNTGFAPQSVETTDFGDFGSADFGATSELTIEKTPKDDVRDDFGDFNVGEAPQMNHSEHDADFGDFATFQDASPPGTELSSQPSEPTRMDKDDSWGDFENASVPSAETSVTEEVRIRDRIRSVALQLPESVLRKSGVSGDHVDLGEVFEMTIGITSSMTEQNRRRAERCIQVLECLTCQGDSKLASTFWIQIFDIVNEELDQAKTLLVEAESFSSNEWNHIKAPISVMIRGLAEYMRVTRSIVATIGDILFLDESAMLTVDTWASTWCSLSILEKALAGEKKWKEIQTQLVKTPLDVVAAATVQEIRSDAHFSQGRSDADSFCYLTLQPLRQKDRSTTRNKVSFQGKSFMACSANFLANRCTFFSVS